MPYRDTLVTCSVCGRSFIWTVTEQRQAAEAGQPLVKPELCPADRQRDPLTGRWLGRIKWYSSEKGYGFIIRSDGEEIFFHRTGVLPPGPAYLKEGTPVTFEIEATPGSKPKAVGVAPAGPVPLSEEEEGEAGGGDEEDDLA